VNHVVEVRDVVMKFGDTTALDGVTSEQIQAVAKKYYVPANRTAVDRVPEVAK